MRAIIGLGNPDFRYVNTRHNIGFTILDLFAQKHNLELSPGKGDFFFCESQLKDTNFLLVKPVTYMNLSGIATRQISDNYSLDPKNILIISDDINLPEGKIRIRQSGGDGGHNGIKSIIYHLETDQFPRIRFGIGNDFKDGKQADFVLGKMNSEILSRLKPAFDFSVSLIEEFIIGGTQAMLNLFSTISQSFGTNKTEQ